MTQQPSLFDAPVLIKNPLCIYERHCGAKAELGPRIAWEGGYNETVTCERCQRVGERSTRNLEQV
jgi:hypothetical protein